MSNIFWFQLLKREEFWLFSVLYPNKLNLFGFVTVDI